LEYIEEDETLDAVGLEALALNNAPTLYRKSESGLPQPGNANLGVPGCGKSLIAKTTSRSGVYRCCG